MKKRIFALLLLLTVISFTACGTSGCSGKNGSSDPDTESSGVTGESDPGVTGDSQSAPDSTDRVSADSNVPQSEPASSSAEPIVLPIDPVEPASDTTGNSGGGSVPDTSSGSQEHGGDTEKSDAQTSRDTDFNIDIGQLIDGGGEIVLPFDDDED